MLPFFLEVNFMKKLVHLKDLISCMLFREKIIVSSKWTIHLDIALLTEVKYTDGKFTDEQ